MMKACLPGSLRFEFRLWDSPIGALEPTSGRTLWLPSRLRWRWELAVWRAMSG